MFCRTYPNGTFDRMKYVVILSRMDGKIMLSRHRERTTWETQGGHIEPGETPLEAAKRELWEESGAVDFELVPLCEYLAGDEDGSAAGAVFTAEIKALGEIPESEMAEIRLFNALPENITYPGITPVLFERAGV